MTSTVTMLMNMLAVLQLNWSPGNGGMSGTLILQSERWPNLQHRTDGPQRQNVYTLSFYLANSGNGQNTVQHTVDFRKDTTVFRKLLCKFG